MRSRVRVIVPTQTLDRKPTRTTPAVGMGATKLYPQDKYPLRIVKVSPTGHAIWVDEVRTVGGATGHAPNGNCNGYPVWDHTYTDADLDQFTEPGYTQKATRRADGTYRLVGEQPVLWVSRACYFRNFAD